MHTATGIYKLGKCVHDQTDFCLFTVCLMLRVDSAGVQYRHNQAEVTIEGTKLKYLHMEQQVSD